MSSNTKHKWTFRARFRRHAFGWRSQPAIKRIKEAVSEIKKIARKDPILAAEGAVLFLEKVSPAIEQVDSSSGSTGSAVNRAINTLVPIIAGAPADDSIRDRWLDRLWQAVEDDDMPYLEEIPEHWGTLCVTKQRASYWADEFINITRMALSPDRATRGYFKGTTVCLSALFHAERYDEILALVKLDPRPFFPYSKWGVKALAAMGQVDEAIQLAEDSRDINQSSTEIAIVCEELLLAAGRVEEAYEGYAIQANWKSTYLATFRAVTKKYPHVPVADVLHDLVESTPDEEGKWFAAAKSAGLYDEAIKLANRTPCDPKTLTRAARDMAEKEPLFAVEAGVAALFWMVKGYYYEITNIDVREAYQHTMRAAENLGRKEKTYQRIRDLILSEEPGFVADVLGRKLGLSSQARARSWL